MKDGVKLWEKEEKCLREGVNARRRAKDRKSSQAVEKKNLR
ncbi:MAG TPA: hypothetical protein VEF33_09265 [Syntrophales bacterium]|nr:hypothetical protein [Syntrophales bacterium]